VISMYIAGMVFGILTLGGLSLGVMLWVVRRPDWCVRVGW